MATNQQLVLLNLFTVSQLVMDDQKKKREEEGPVGSYVRVSVCVRIHLKGSSPGTYFDYGTSTGQ